MSPHRTPAEVPPLADVTNVPRVDEHRGPRSYCPVCGLKVADRSVIAFEVTMPYRACTGRSGWFQRLFGLGCARDGVHLHQTCTSCKASWACAPLEAS